MGSETIFRALSIALGGFAGGVACLSGTAQAETPARAWHDVERIALRCSVEGPMAAGDAAQLCRALEAEARTLTAYPVREVSGDGDLGESDFLIDLRIVAASARPGKVALQVSGRRIGLTRMETPQTQPLPMPLTWSRAGPRLAGRVRALELFLGRGGRGRSDPRDWNRGDKSGS